MNLRRHRTESPRIDITPLIDVVFLMLIFFMVSTTFDKQTQLKVDLPSAATTAEKESETEQIEITIDAQGQFYVNERELVRHDAATLKRTLQQVSDGRLDLPVIVSGDRKAPLQSMMTVMDVSAQLGMSRLSFVARHEADEPAR
jgi:biopolymer transport protein ExbD